MRRRRASIRAMTPPKLFTRLAMLLGLFAAPMVLAAPAHAKETEAQIQAEIDAQVKADDEARAKAQAAAEAARPPAPPPAPVAPPVPAVPAGPVRTYKSVSVILTTSLGPITIALEVERAPLTAGNFLKYVDQKRLDGTTFYRGFTFADRHDLGFIQGGTQNDPKRILKPVAHEPTSETGLTHSDGTISLAQAAPGTATCDFFIVIGDMTGFDAKPGDPGFAAFGHVTQGMDLVRKIVDLPKSATKGVGTMKGEMLEQPVTIITARRAPEPAP